MSSKLFQDRQKHMGTNRKTFCKTYGIPYQTYAKVEVKYQKCSKPLQRKLSEIFDIPIEDLFENGFVRRCE